MKRDNVKQILCAAAGTVLASIASTAHAQITVDGTLDGSYGGNPLAVQTIGSSFGSGDQLDAFYANVSNNTLYMFFAGNLEGGNHLNVFIQDAAPGGQNVLNISAGGSLASSNGFTLPSGFSPTYALEVNPSGGNMYLDQYGLTGGTVHNYLGFASVPGGVGNAQNLGGIAIGFNNSNAAGTTGVGSGSAANQSAAAAVTTGIEFGVPLSVFNVSGGSLRVLADINNGGDNYLSNQFLPGLPNGYGSLQSPGSTNMQTNNSNLTPINITVPVNPTGTWLPSTGGSWNNSSNWANSATPNAPGAVALFNGLSSADTVTLDAAITVGSITFNSAAAYNIAAGTSGVLTMDGNGSNAVITTYGGSHTISAPMVLHSTTSFVVVNHGDSLTVSGNINGSGQLMVTNPGGGTSQVLLSGSNTYTGGTDVEAGNLTLGSPTALPANTVLTLSAKDLPAGVLDLNNNSAGVSSITVTTGPQTIPTGAAAKIINSSATPGTATLTYAGNISNPSTFTGKISDSNGSGGSTTALLVTSGSLTLTGSNTYAGGTNVAGGTLIIGAANAVSSGGNLTVGAGASVVASTLGTKAPVVVGSLSVIGKLDLNNNGLDVRNSNLSSVSALVASGFNGGASNGSTGIISSTATADTTHLTALGTILNNTDGSTPLYNQTQPLGKFMGVNPGATDVLVKYTYFGDANLNGVVDGSDYSLIDNGYLMHLTGWFNGDFNYDGTVNGSDYTLIDNAFNQQGASEAAAIANPSALATAQIAGTSAVPEPTSLGLLTICALGLLGRRRRP